MNAETWVNTPGIYYAIAYWLGSNLMILNGPRRTGWQRTALVQGTFLVLLSTIMTVSDGSAEYLFIPFMMLYMLMIWGSLYINCEYDMQTAAYFAVRAFIIGEFMASFEWQLFYYAVRNLEVPVSLAVNAGFLIVIHGLVYTILFRLERQNQEVNANLQINTRELLSSVIIGLAIFAVSNTSYILGNSPFSSQFVAEIFIIRTLVDLGGGVAVLHAYHIQLGELKVRLEMEKLQDVLNMQHNNYEILEQSLAAVDQKYHDLKHQITLLKQEVPARESIAYLDQMEREIKAYEAQNNTGNKVLDTILTGKTLYCQNNWIELTCVADGTATLFIDNMDICTLFGNMLDNAIESVEKVEDKEKRLIHLAVTKQKGFLRIRMENCYRDELIFENGLPRTTKRDKRYHGFGLKSIQSTVKKYDGSVTINARDGWFELRILIPLPEEMTDHES